MPDEAAQRAEVLRVARTWLGTPFHDGAQLKDVGVDCAHLLAAVYVEAGVIPDPVQIEGYSPQFMLHRDQPLFEEYVLRYSHELPEGQLPQLADVVLYKVGRSFAHGGIVVEWPRAVIHAFKAFGLVAETGAYDSTLRRRDVKFFSMWG